MIESLNLELNSSFRGNHITACGDYQAFHDSRFLAQQLPFSARLKALEKLDIYVQTFSLSGKVFVENLEEEVYLWGYRRKQALDRNPSEVKLEARITAYTEVTFFPNYKFLVARANNYQSSRENGINWFARETYQTLPSFLL